MPFDFKQGVNVSEIAGTGIEASANDLRLSTQGNGIAGGGGSTLSVDSDTETGGNIQGANITANGVGIDIAAIVSTGLEADGSANIRIDTGATVDYSSDTPVITFGNETTGEGLFVSGVPVDANHVVNKTFVDSAITGIAWKKPVSTKDYLGTRTVAEINALSPTSGQTVVSADAGTPSAGTSDALVAGSVAEFDGTSWKEIVAGSGGFVPDGTRLLVHDETVTLFSPLTDNTDESKFADFDGTTNTPTLTSPLDGDGILVAGNGSFNEFNGYTFDTGTSAWVQFTGAGQINAGTGLTKSGNTLDVVGGDGITANANDIAVDLLAGGGLKFTTAELGVEPNDFAGTGLEDDGSDNLRLSAQGNGIAGGAGSTLSVASDTATGATVAAVSVTSNGVGVAIDNDTIVHDNAGPDVLSVGANSIGTAEIAEGEAFAFTEATGTTETPGDNSTKLATTAYADAAVAACWYGC